MPQERRRLFDGRRIESHELRSDYPGCSRHSAALRSPLHPCGRPDKPRPAGVPHSVNREPGKNSAPCAHSLFGGRRKGKYIKSAPWRCRKTSGHEIGCTRIFWPCIRTICTEIKAPWKVPTTPTRASKDHCTTNGLRKDSIPYPPAGRNTFRRKKP